MVTAKSLGEASGDFICSALVMPIILMFGPYRDITGWRFATAVMAGIIIVFSVSLSSRYCIYNLGNENLVSTVYMIATVAQILSTCMTPLLYR